MTGARILLVDDEPAILGVLGRALARAGYQVDTASQADSAYAILGERAVDLVLLDLRLGQIRGDVLALAVLRRWPRLRGRIVLMSGDPDASDGWPPELRACPVLAKPFPLDLLYRTIAATLHACEAPAQVRATGAA
ncbi:MAG TPA: response regulator [Gemmatimonadales bacterium]|nr:response regulator [Gemmatimonadales bacterium]